METLASCSELYYLSPTTREKALSIARELMKAGDISPREALNKAILSARNWAVKNINRSVWKTLKKVEPEII